MPAIIPEPTEMESSVNIQTFLSLLIAMSIGLLVAVLLLLSGHVSSQAQLASTVLDGARQGLFGEPDQATEVFGELLRTVVSTDHHLPALVDGEVALPEADVIVNPSQPFAFNGQTGNTAAVALGSARHLVCRTARKGQQQDAARIGALRDDMGDSMCKGVGLAGPGSGDHQQRLNRSPASSSTSNWAITGPVWTSFTVTL